RCVPRPTRTDPTLSLHAALPICRGSSLLRERVRPEMHQSVVETGTGICRDIKQAREEITELRGSLNALAVKGGMRIVAAGTHPRSEEHTSELQSRENLVCRLLLE